MTTHRCLDDGTLKAYLTGQLSEADAVPLEEALEVCADCRRLCETVEWELAERWRNGILQVPSPTDSEFDREPQLAALIQRVLTPEKSGHSTGDAATEETVVPTDRTGQVTGAPDTKVPTGWGRLLTGISCGEFLLRLKRSRLLSDTRLSKIAGASESGRDAVDLAICLIATGELTDWQLDQLAEGNTALLLDNGRYELRDRIGQGGMGAVYLARHRLMQRDVAVKVIDPRKVTNPQLVSRFQREVEASSRLQHEHIVQALDVGRHGDLSFLVLEYVHGSDLAAIVKRDGPLSPDEAAAIGLQAASALAYAHAQGVVHRDIKPQNILLSSTGVTKILDMGLARISRETTDDHTSLTQEGMLLGTVDYMAPEQARDTRTAETRSDLYSLGATLYYLLVGKPPFAGGTTIDKLTRLATAAPPSLGLQRLDCPAELTRLVERLMAKSPEDRPASAEEVVRALRPFAAEKVAGRAVVTAAVQAAADGQHPATERTSPSGPSLIFETPSALSMMRRKKAAVPWKLWGGLGLTAMASLTALALLVPMGKRPTATTVHSESTLTSTGGSVASASPSQFTVDIGGHWGEDHQDYWIRPGSWLLTMVPGQGDQTERFRGAIAWSPDDNWLATANGDADVRIRNAATGKTTFVYRGHPARILDVVWGPDGQTLASCDMEGNVQVWSVGQSQPLATHRLPFQFPLFHMGLAFAPDGRHVAIAQNEASTKLLRWNWRENRIVASWSMHGGLLCYAPSGRFLANWGRKYQSSDEFLSVADESTDAVLPSLQTEGPTPRPLGFTDDDRLLTISADKTRLAAWDPATGALIAEHSLSEGSVVWGISRKEGRVLVRQGTTLATVQLAAGGGEFTVTETPLTYEEQANPCVSNALTRGLAYLRAEHGPGTFIVSLPDGRRIANCPVSSALLQPTRELISGRYLRLPQGVLDLETGESWSRFPDVAHVLPDGRLRAIVAGRILEWPGVDRQNEPFRVAAELEASPENVLYRFIDNGRHLLGGREHLQVRDAETGRIVASYHDTSEFDPGVVARSGDVQAWKSTGPAGERVLRVVRGGPKPLDLTLPMHSQQAGSRDIVEISDDGRFVVTLTSIDADHRQFGEPKLAELSDLSASPIVPRALQSRQRNALDHLVPAFAPGGRYLFLNDEVWETGTGQRVWVAPERSRVRSAYWSGRGQSVAAMNDERRIVISQDNQVQIWDWTTNRKLATVFWMPANQWALVNHVTGCWTGTDLATQYLRVAAAASKGEPVWLTPAQYEKRTGWKNVAEQAGLSSGTHRSNSGQE